MDFVNEGKLDDERKRRQAEWERVRKPEDPVEAPPEVFDNRSLYDRLKEQHEIKKKDFEDTFALKNQVRGIDVDEANFLSECDEARIKREREIRLEEKKEIAEVKKATTSNAPAAAALPKINLSLPSHKKENKQAELLSSVVLTKRKSGSQTTTTATTPSAAAALLKSNELPKKSTSSSNDLDSELTKTNRDDEEENDEEEEGEESLRKKQRTNVIVAGILPGIGNYGSDTSSDSNSSSDDDDDEQDLSTSEIIGAKSLAK